MQHDFFRNEKSLFLFHLDAFEFDLVVCGFAFDSFEFEIALDDFNAEFVFGLFIFGFEIF